MPSERTSLTLTRRQGERIALYVEGYAAWRTNICVDKISDNKVWLCIEYPDGKEVRDVLTYEHTTKVDMGSEGIVQITTDKIQPSRVRLRVNAQQAVIIKREEIFNEQTDLLEAL